MAEERKSLQIEPDKKDIMAFVIAFWQIFLPMILVFALMFAVALLILYLM